ncbi:Uma2 family endonuclease [Ancylothrix sp. C2]|uniref:Uma2 family endonuclease n=1 Tax=Ancylothrix sp. D3o TaxID=2953691 RepID=UPI0021BA6015|nr:Uma2 family endonuclease [Ancylothrix sp. D3o]MCT7952555.1 Uma2 family endonuclease [Ancylothrix sp. D3o]
MTQALTKKVTFDEFIAWYPEKSENRYELHNGVIVEMPKPRGKHSEIAGFITLEIGIHCRLKELPYFIPKELILKPFRDESGYEPDVIVLDKQKVEKEPLWATSSVISMGSSVRLIVEIASTNWRDDYALKAADYEEMAIAEYWIIDYLGLGGRRFIGSEKLPTLSVYQLVDGEYEVSQFRGSETVISGVFPELNLTAEQIFGASL